MAAKATRSSNAAPPTGPRDFVQVAIAYAREATADRNGKKFGKWIRLAAARFLRDLKTAKAKGAPFKFDPWWANDVCLFAEQLPHVEGVWDTPNIVLHPSHVFFLVNLFGFRKPDGTRRFTTALKAVGRKNAKSTLGAIVELYCLTCEGEVGPQVITAATTGQQARMVFNTAKRMVEKTSDLREAFNLEPFAHAIACYLNGGTLKPINAKASTQDGLNPSCVVLDEVHAHKTHDLLNVLKSAAGARRNPLFLFITTEGYETPGPWPEQRRFAEQLLEGAVEADHYLAVIYAVDDDDDDFDESKWIKANPLADVNPLLLAEIAKEAIEAKAMPGRHAEFKIKRLNRRAAAASAWIDIPRWNQCGGVVDLEALRGVPCFGGMDLASTKDMTAFRLVWRVDGKWVTWGKYWVPRDAVAQRTERGTVPYAAWVASGHVVQTDGDVTDYRAIEEEIIALRDRFNIVGIAYDSWNATDLVNRLVEQQLPMVQFIQGTKSYHPAMQELERAYTAGALNHGDDPVLRWNAANVVARKDANNNTAPDKRRSADKIDGLVALLMAIGATLAQPAQPTKSVYDRRDLLMV
jgi:phage terminase large subunit-like protein